ncbi:MAG: hypothetical protein COB08_012740 [Rhodobacteraceae bacterium]|nr:hypothetical protein [Paracoccaceae bacterium]
MLKKAVCALAALSGAASAETMTCPVGGERFEAPVSAFCEGGARRTMLLMPEGCPPSPLLQCPQNFLPVYRDFSEQELPLVAQYMQTESYESSVDFSSYLLAYDIEKFLSVPDSPLPRLLLERGLWQDMSLISDAYFVDTFTYEFGGLSRNLEPDKQAEQLTRLAFVALLAGRSFKSEEYLAHAENAQAQGPDALDYLKAVRACVADQSQPHCRPDALIPGP